MSNVTLKDIEDIIKDLHLMRPQGHNENIMISIGGITVLGNKEFINSKIKELNEKQNG